MEKYFCNGCLQHWKINKFMMCCPGCVGHKEQGWTPTKMLDIYGPIYTALDTDKAYFPMLNPEPHVRIAKPHKINTTALKDWLGSSIRFLPDFGTQQLAIVEKFPNTYWNIIDPFVQAHVVGALRL